jgi:hypothetical protein
MVNQPLMPWWKMQCAGGPDMNYGDSAFNWRPKSFGPPRSQ